MGVIETQCVYESAGSAYPGFGGGEGSCGGHEDVAGDEGSVLRMCG